MKLIIMSKIKSFYHDTIEKSMRLSEKAGIKCKRHKWTKEGVAYPYSICKNCGQLKKTF
jgi:hypothetical protein